MGNSPSKNEAQPTSSSQSASGSSPSGDLDPDDTRSALSSNLSHFNAPFNDKQLDSGSIRSSAINIHGPNAYYTKKKESLDLDLEIGMARLLKRDDYASSYDSEVSGVSPVFTAHYKDKDDSSLSSFNSNSPVAKKGSPNTLKKLDSIAEGTYEISQPSLSQKNLRRHQRSMAPLTKAPSSSSSNLSSSPPLVHANKKLDIDVDSVIDRLLEAGMKKSRNSKKDLLPVSVSEIKYILHKARSIFMEQPTLLRLSPPVKIVGDIHGQFSDLIRIFNSCGYPPYSNYLFLGDYVDRGHKSLETMLLLLCYKIKYPENFFMLRGNHESANITKIYGFYDECKRRLPHNRLWRNFVDVFNTLPIAATINDKIFCIHGGLSPDLHDLEQIEDIKRPTDIPDKGLLADLLWSDPDRSVKNFSTSNWPKNDRGVSYCFGRKHVDYFCSRFNMDLIVRGHMVVEDGYEFFNKRRLVTVFSAPNYCGEFNNFGAVMCVDKSLYCSFELIKPA